MRHHVAIDLELANIPLEFFKLVVPSKFALLARESERGSTVRNLDHRMFNRRSKNSWRERGTDFLAKRQLMKHVSQCLDMHQPMFNGDIEQRIE